MSKNIEMDKKFATTIALDNITGIVLIPMIDDELDSEFLKASLKHVADVCMRQAAISINEYNITLDEIMTLYNSVKDDEEDSMLDEVFKLGIPFVYSIVS